ncbi:MAG: septum formation initiator family protein [Patescibacteria group bacterium]
MREFQEKNRIRRILYSKFFIIVLILLVGFMSMSVIKIYKKYRESKMLAEKTEQELKELETKKAELESSTAKLQTESGTEKEIRSTFNVKKPGEEAIVIVEKNEENGKIDSEEQGFFSRIWQAIKSIFK